MTRFARLGLTPRIAIVIVGALLTMQLLDDLLVAAVPPPRVLFYTHDWFVEQIVRAVEVADRAGTAERARALAALDSDWLVHSISSTAPERSESSLQAVPNLERAIEAKLPRLNIAVTGAPIEDPERQTSPISVLLPGTPAYIENILDDELRGDVIAAGRLRVDVQLADGAWLTITEPGHEAGAALRMRNAAVYVGAMLLIVAFAILAARMIIRPLKQLSRAADRLGREREPTPIPSSSVPEIDAIAATFNQMQARLKRFVDERTYLLAAISHDLRTPLTRLRLFAEYVQEPKQRALLLGDIEDMEKMVRASLDFTSNDLHREAHARVDMAALLMSLCDTLSDAGCTASYEGPDHADFTCRATAMRRALSNLIDNACKYGHEAKVTLHDQPDRLEVLIEDRGPGIPPDRIEEAFQPFRRLEGSRNRESGGVGLGLTIARDVINEHGGSLELSAREPVGLRVKVALPKPPVDH